MVVVRLLAVLVLLALAGCSSPQGPDPPAEAPSAPVEEEVEEDPADAADAQDDVVVTSGKYGQQDAPQVTWRTYSTQGTTTANAAGWGLDTALGLGVRAMDLYVPANATALVIELVWDDAVQDLDAEAHAPEEPLSGSGSDCGAASLLNERVWCDIDGSIGAPDRPSRIDLRDGELASVLDDCEQPSSVDWGDCNVFAIGFRSKDANALLDWQLLVTVFEGGAPPKGFSALAPAN